MTEGNEAVQLYGCLQGMNGSSKDFFLGEYYPGGSKEFRQRFTLDGLTEITKLRYVHGE